MTVGTMSVSSMSTRRPNYTSEGQRPQTKDQRPRTKDQRPKTKLTPLQPFLRLERHQRILDPQCDHTVVVADLGNLAAHEPVAETPQFESIEIIDEIVDQFRTRGRSRLDTVRPELREDIGAVLVAGQR